MEKDDMKKCPYCAELIKKEAIKCRYCGSMLTKKEINFDFLSTAGYWHRVNEGKKIGGVCTGIAKELDSSILILPLRLFFILTTIFYGFGIILYVILWILMPAPIDPPGGGGQSTREESAQSTESGSTETTPLSTQDTNESDSHEESMDKDVKMSNLPRNFAMLAVIVILLISCYSLALDIVLDIAVSPFLLFSCFIFAGIPLIGAVMALYFKKIHFSLANVQ